MIRRMSVVVLFVFLVLLRPPSSTLFPYTTLFRSWPEAVRAYRWGLESVVKGQLAYATKEACERPRTARGRSEEHTSELQSRENLVCRLLLEKKKKKNYPEDARMRS